MVRAGDSKMTSENVSLDSVITNGSSSGMTALLYCPAAFQFGKVSDNSIRVFDGADEQAIDLASVYEARLFNSTTEIHWRRAGETGRSVTRTKAADELPLNYLLWGRVESVAGSWSQIASLRTPSFWVPFVAKIGQSLTLTGMEAILRGVDGNAYIAGERLTGLALAE
jgi:CRISPR-associated protein (TIGR03984 family)